MIRVSPSIQTSRRSPPLTTLFNRLVSLLMTQHRSPPCLISVTFHTINWTSLASTSARGILSRRASNVATVNAINRRRNQQQISEQTISYTWKKPIGNQERKMKSFLLFSDLLIKITVPFYPTHYSYNSD